MHILSWNLYHGRDFPPDRSLFTWRSRLLGVTERNETHVQVNRPLLEEFTRLLAGLDWQVAMLQEAPPRWFRPLGQSLGASGALALTSRNCLPPLQRVLADWNPDLLASSEGGSNQMLVRGRIESVRRLLLTRRPERRCMLWVRVSLPEGRLCVANLHASAGLPHKAAVEVELAAERAVEWAEGDPLVLGGDFNVRPRRAARALRAAARALRPGAAHRPRGDRPSAGPRRPGGRGAPAASPGTAGAGRARRPPAAPGRPRPCDRGLWPGPACVR